MDYMINSQIPDQNLGGGNVQGLLAYDDEDCYKHFWGGFMVGVFAAIAGAACWLFLS